MLHGMMKHCLEITVTFSPFHLTALNVQ
uniref:Uncharacterized protein n=1 Tax=Anguilla anguilla TaxID=7936 RepID=A0A0E9VF85_ANGAN